MKATDLDNDVTCPICQGTGNEPAQRIIWGDCPLCEGAGSYNRYQGRQPAVYDVGTLEDIIVDERYIDEGSYARYGRFTMPIEHPVLGGFNGFFGDYVPPNHDPNNHPSEHNNRLTDATDLPANNAVGWAQSNGGANWGNWLQKLIQEQPGLSP